LEVENFLYYGHKLKTCANDGSNQSQFAARCGKFATAWEKGKLMG